MTKWILLIGVLTYSSVGWSETLVLECFSEDKHLVTGESIKSSSGIYKMETDQPDTSEDFFMYRSEGRWKSMCKFSKCEKRDRSVKTTSVTTPEDLEFLEKEGFEVGGEIPNIKEQFFDFEFFRVENWKWSYDRSRLLFSSKWKCERIN